MGYSRPVFGDRRAGEEGETAGRQTFQVPIILLSYSRPVFGDRRAGEETETACRQTFQVPIILLSHYVTLRLTFDVSFFLAFVRGEYNNCVLTVFQFFLTLVSDTFV